MHATTHYKMNHYRRQAGAALFMSLIFLLIMTILGVFGMNVSRMENLMAGNTQFQTTALNNAEFVLAEAEKELKAFIDGKEIVVYDADGNRDSACEDEWASATSGWGNADCDYFYGRIDAESILVGDLANLIWDFNAREVVLPDGVSTGYYVLENTGQRTIPTSSGSMQDTRECGGRGCVWVFLATAQASSSKGARRIVQSVIVTEQPPPL